MSRAADRPYLIKLVRDRIRDSFVNAEHRIAYYQIGDHARFIEYLRKKLIEEAAEYVVKPGAVELADVLETVRGLARHDLGVTMEEIEDTAADKHRERGGFEDGIGMWAVPG